MSIITFWNNSKKGNIGQTSSLIAVSTLMSIEHNYKILGLTTEELDLEIEKAFGISESVASKVLGLKEGKFNSGIEGIMKLATSGKITPEMIGNYTKIVLKNRLEVLGGKRPTDDDEIEKFDHGKYPEIVKNANKFYDMVFVDLSGDIKDNNTRKMLEASDIIVINMEQRMDAVERVIELQKNEELVSGKNVLYLINRYEKNSRYNIKNLIRNSTIKKNIYALPYDLMFSDILQSGTTENWFLNTRIRKATIDEEHGYFIKEINRLCDGIIYKLQELHVL